MTEGTLYFLIPVAIFAIIFFIAAFNKSRARQEPSDEINKSSNYESTIGNQWKTIPNEFDLSEWEEIYSVKKYEHHAASLSPAIKAVDKPNSIENQEISLFDVRTILTSNDIDSKISDSRNFPSSQGLFVRKENYEKALRILKQS